MNRFSAKLSDEKKLSYLYDILYRAMNTTEFSGTDVYNVLNGYRGLLGNEAKGVWNSKILPENATYGDYKAELNGNCPIEMSIRAPGVNICHDVMVIGYAQSTTGVNYLFVMDGDKEYGRFLKFSSYYPFRYGRKIWVD